uniref:Pyrin domain-containing protein n=1 Tax=Astatotilapia calliptera TaxID=8154 RepID=A0A3P8NIH6_ASTCA
KTHIPPFSRKQTGVLKEWLWETLETLGTEELKNFKWCLQNVTESRDGFKPIKKSRLENADRLDTVDLMVQMYDTKTAAVTKKILKKIKRNEGLLFRGNIKAVPVVLNNNENESIIEISESDEVSNATILKAILNLEKRVDEQLADLSVQCKQASTMLASLAKAVQFNSEEVKECKQKVRELERRNEQLTKDNYDLKERVREQERYKMRWCLRIKGLEEKRDEDPIQENKLTKAERHAMVDLMVQKYEISGAVEVMESVLLKISRNDLVEKLRLLTVDTPI